MVLSALPTLRGTIFSISTVNISDKIYSEETSDNAMDLDAATEENRAEDYSMEPSDGIVRGPGVDLFDESATDPLLRETYNDLPLLKYVKCYSQSTRCSHGSLGHTSLTMGATQFKLRSWEKESWTSPTTRCTAG